MLISSINYSNGINGNSQTKLPKVSYGTNTDTTSFKSNQQTNISKSAKDFTSIGHRISTLLKKMSGKDKSVENISSNKKKEDKKVTLEDAKHLTTEDISTVEENKKYTSYKFPNSKQLEDFSPLLNKTTREKGISTKNYIGGCFLKGTPDIPLGTSGVGNCAVLCMQNSKTGTQALYHEHPARVESMRKDIQVIMPEGFDKVTIIPGRNPQTAQTAINLLNAARKINRNAEVEFRHAANGDNTQIIFYEGKVYSLPLKNDTPSFKICEEPENYYIGYALK